MLCCISPWSPLPKIQKKTLGEALRGNLIAFSCVLLGVAARQAKPVESCGRLTSQPETDISFWGLVPLWFWVQALGSLEVTGSVVSQIMHQWHAGEGGGPPPTDHMFQLSHSGDSQSCEPKKYGLRTRPPLIEDVLRDTNSVAATLAYLPTYESVQPPSSMIHMFNIIERHAHTVSGFSTLLYQSPISNFRAWTRPHYALVAMWIDCPLFIAAIYIPGLLLQVLYYIFELNASVKSLSIGVFGHKSNVFSTWALQLKINAPLTPMTSHSSDWIIFMQSASKQGWSKDDFGNGPVSDLTALANEVTPPDQRLVQAAVRPTSHNNTIAPHTGFLTQALQSASANRCLDIIKALQGPFYHKLVFDNVTPEEYNTLSLLISKDHRLIYHPDLSQLVAMVPYEIHELAMNNFSERVHNLLQPFQLSDDMDVMAIVNGNLAISDRDFEVIPNFHLSLRSLHNYGGQALIPWWVDFDHTTSIVTLDPVVVGDVTWVEIKSIKLHIFLRGDDGNFDFSGKGPLCAQGSVFPNMQMDTINQLLNLATKCLFLKITSMMEEASTTASFPCEWSSLLHAAYHSLSNTAYKRYCKWYNQLPPINNSNDPPPGGPGGPGGPGVPGPSRKQPSTPKPSPSSKQPTSHYSSSWGQQGKSHKRRRSGKKAGRK
ncbi:hypothetical protein BDN67DRAFT_982859 [Paxillus ammoniavirescens]|nr:hypothetical protein BDN67DRAFT_982859 [Paxillus ammoniavirescens]